MNNDVKDPAEICKAIAVDFKRRGLTHRTAGEMLGLSKQSVSNQISGKKPFSLKAAQRYADTLGYDIRFLLFGKGNLYPNIKPEVQKACSFSRKDPSPVDLRVHSKIARLLLRLLNNRDAIEAYDALLANDIERHQTLYYKIHKDFGWQVHPADLTDESVERMRTLLAEFHEERSKMLARQMNMAILNGYRLSVDYLMKDCEEYIKRLKKENPDLIL